MSELVCDECGTPLVDGGVDWYCPSKAPHPKHDAMVREMVSKNMPPSMEEVRRLRAVEAAAMEVLETLPYMFENRDCSNALNDLRKALEKQS